MEIHYQWRNDCHLSFKKAAQLTTCSYHTFDMQVQSDFTHFTLGILFTILVCTPITGVSPLLSEE